MPLTLTIRNATRLDNGSPLCLVLDRRGATIGRAATTDWCLPDPSLHISSRHCEIRFTGELYELHDLSTNGTFLAGEGARLAAPHVLKQGDVFLIGNFEIAAALDDASAGAAAALNAAPPVKEWQGWAAAAGDGAAPAASPSAWDAPRPGSAMSGTGPMSQSWAPPAAAGGWGETAPSPVPAPATTPAPPPQWGPPPTAAASTAGGATSGWGAPPAPASAPTPPPAPSAWDQGAAASPGSPSVWDAPSPPPPVGASDWSSPVTPPPPPSPDDIWGSFAQQNVVDWARGGFGSPPPPPLTAAAPPPPVPSSPAPAAPPTAAASTPAPAPAATGGTGGLAVLANSAGIDQAKLRSGEQETLSQAGSLLRRLVAGLVVMLEARARAKSQMGAQGTALEFDGNNPLKFARTPEQALLQLLNPAERGFMPGERAIEDAFKDLQAHQMASLKAMQGALRATLDRFSPTAIRQRAEQGGVLSRIIPGAQDAALWKAYEREFGGVVHGSDEAFMDMFAKEFRKAYEELTSRR